MKRIRKAKLFVFLRKLRHELFNEAFQQELAHLYRPAERGQPPVPPAMLTRAPTDFAGTSQIARTRAVEHTLAHVGWWQGRRARYRGMRKNLFDLRRCAVIHNLHVLARSQQKATEIQDAA